MRNVHAGHKLETVHFHLHDVFRAMNTLWESILPAPPLRVRSPGGASGGGMSAGSPPAGAQPSLTNPSAHPPAASAHPAETAAGAPSRSAAASGAACEPRERSAPPSHAPSPSSLACQFRQPRAECTATATGAGAATDRPSPSLLARPASCHVPRFPARAIVHRVALSGGNKAWLLYIH